MRRLLALLALTAAATATPALAAPSSASVKDARGDWVAGSADVVAVRVTSAAPRGQGGTVTVEIELAAAPDATTGYYASLGGAHECDVWDFRVTGLGSAAQDASWQLGPCSARQYLVTDTTDRSRPATATVRGTTVVLTAPYGFGLRRGLRLTGLGAAAFTAPAGACSGTSEVALGCVFTGDLASGPVSYRLR